MKHIFFPSVNQEHIDFFMWMPQNNSMENDMNLQTETVKKPSRTSPKKQKKKRRILPTVLLALVLAVLICATSAGAYVLYWLNGLEQARQAADALKAQGEYGQAIAAYAQLMEDDPMSFTPFGNAFVSAGADGVISCADALLENNQGARYLTENRLLEDALSLATHPAVPATFAPALERRSLLCEAILAEEAGDLTKALELLNQADLHKELSYPLEQQIALADALQAREEGRYEDALEILTNSILNSGLMTEIQQQITDEQDADTAAAARAAMADKDLETALKIAQRLSRLEDQLALEEEFTQSWSETLSALHEQYQDKLLSGAWYSLILGEVSQLTGDKRYDGIDLVSLQEGKVIGGLFSLIQLTDGRVQLIGDTLGSELQAHKITDATDAALGMNHGLVLHGNGTVTLLGATQYGRKDAASWTDIVKVAAGGYHSLGLKSDGTVVAAGLNLDGQCKVSKWKNVVAVAAGVRHSVALRQDGTVVAAGDNSFGQCNVSDWKNVIEIRCGGNFTLGLTSDWRLLATGDNGCGQCDVFNWREVIAFDAGLWHTTALLSNGRIVTAGANGHSQCDMDGTVIFQSKRNLEQTAAVHPSETEFVYTGHETNGPWLYYNGDGCVTIGYDVDTGKINATRADIICTDGHPPLGILAGGGDKPGRQIQAPRVAKQNRAVFAITGDYFNFDYNADGLQIRRGVVFKQEKNEVGFSFFPDGSMRIVDPNTTTADDLLSQGIRDSWVFGPTLILDGTAQDISGHPLSYNDITMRTVFASICPYHHVAAAYGVSTLAQVTADLLDYGCTIAYNLDGGRSCWMVFMGKIINRSRYLNNGWRGLEDMIGFLTSELVPKP